MCTCTRREGAKTGANFVDLLSLAHPSHHKASFVKFVLVLNDRCRLSTNAPMSTTPRSKHTADPATPVSVRLSGSASSALQSSPHYATTRRHSLYGTEDRIVLDPGSRVWKTGFSGEGRPRDVFFSQSDERTVLWGLSRERRSEEQEAEEDRILKINVQDRLRRMFHEYVFIVSIVISLF
jgi:hypothetical protein